MLTLQHRIILEDDHGEKHTLHLLEIVSDQFFVLLPPEQAERLGTLQSRFTSVIDGAMSILLDSLSVISIREHRFLQRDELPPVLARSRHHILRMCGLRLIDALPGLRESSEEALSHAFAEECRRRQGW